MSVPVSLTIPQFANSFDGTYDLATRAASLGFAGLMCFDHLVPIGNAKRPILEGAATLGAIAAISTVPVGSLVTRVTLRPPPITAGLGATLSVVGGNQAILGLGAGDRLSDDEARRYGLQRPLFAERIALLETTIALIREAAPTLQIWVGGRHPRIRKVASRTANGWNAWGVSPEELSAEASAVLADADHDLTISWGGGILLAADSEAVAQEVAKRGSREGVIVGTPDIVTRHLAPIATVADHLVLSVLPNKAASWELFATEVLGRLN